MSSTPQDDARAALDAAGQLPDAELDLAAVALRFARIDAPEADWRGAQALLSQIARRAVELANADPAADGGDTARRRALLAHLIHEEFGFTGDAETYDDMVNANIIHVLERRQGLPVALGILWLHAAEAVGWAAHGLNTPGHFLLALPHTRGQIVLDVFAGGTQLLAPELRALIKRVSGEQTELKPGMLAPMTKRDVLLRLQNNIKLRRLQANDLEGGLAATRDMLRVAPGHAGLWREMGLIEHRLERIGAALASLDKALEIEPRGEAAARIRGLVEELRNRLN
ncbi:transglutaminase-like domain-containing protein [Sediminicoccus sp. KRV36]|uniref:SirB1 family protein n=1 Tax=Sediminicoccus sp. KRV36 TaxID=3133721 RepID=UPI002010C386|nr:transglutaminase-like domain-containing protein [Sediminicoccus rosea]UPY37403.1 transglutaminase-like domain-containing protein [Sediminicoccus rosea]